MVIEEFAIFAGPGTEWAPPGVRWDRHLFGPAVNTTKTRRFCVEHFSHRERSAGRTGDRRFVDDCVSAIELLCTSGDRGGAQEKSS